MCAWLDTDQTDMQSTHTNADKTNDFILLPSLAQQDGDLRVRIYVCGYVYAHADVYTHEESLSPEKQFGKQTGQATLIPAIFPYLFLPKLPKSFPGSSLKHPIISSVQSWNAFLQHPPMCSKALMLLHPKSTLTLTHPDGHHTWMVGLRLSWDSPGMDWTECPLFWTCSLGSHLPSPLCSSRHIIAGAIRTEGSCNEPRRSQGRMLLGLLPPATASLCPSVGLQMIFYSTILISISRPLFLMSSLLSKTLTAVNFVRMLFTAFQARKFRSEELILTSAN